MSMKPENVFWYVTLLPKLSGRIYRQDGGSRILWNRVILLPAWRATHPRRHILQPT